MCVYVCVFLCALLTYIQMCQLIEMNIYTSKEIRKFNVNINYALIEIVVPVKNSYISTVSSAFIICFNCTRLCTFP